MKADSDPFTDAPKGNWAAGYIAYCASENIINGNGDGTFRPNDKVTGYEFAKMMLVALGYGVNGEYTGKSWSIAVAKDALPLGLFTEVAECASDSAINREQAFQIVFNTMTKPSTVSYNEAFKLYYSTVPTSGVINNVPANTLGYKKYNMTSASTTDDYGNNAHEWKVGTKVATGKYVDDTVIATVAATDKPADIAKLIGGTTASTITVIVNGDTATSKETPSALITRVANGQTVTLTDTTGDGVADTAIVVIEYLAQVTNVTTTAGVTTVTTSNYYTTGKSTNAQFTSNDYDVSGLAKNDYIIVVPAYSASTHQAIWNQPISFKVVEPVTSGVSSFTTNSVTFDGKTYSYAQVYSNSADLVQKTYAFGANTYDFYFNSNGFVIGATTHTVAAVQQNYVYIADVQGQAASTTLFGSTTGSVKASGYLMDGTAVVLDLAVKTATANMTGYKNGSSAADNIVAGDKYFTVGSDNYLVATVASAGTDYSSLEGKVLAYTTDTEGATTLAPVSTVTIAGVAYTATSAATSITTSAGSAAITLNGPDTVYGTASTKYVTVDTAGTVTTVTGYANFPGTAATPKTYQTTSTATASAIVYATANGVVTDVLVIGVAPQQNTNTTVLVYKGTHYTAPDANGVSQDYYEFVTTDGTAVAYQVSDASKPSSPKDVYNVTITNGVISTLGSAATPVAVTAVDDDYIVLNNGSVFYKTSTSTYYNASSNTVAEWAADTVVVGDSVVVIPGTGAAANNIVNAIITTASTTNR
jgi:hypothetical protein